MSPYPITTLPDYDLSVIFNKGVDVRILSQHLAKSTLIFCSSCLSLSQAYETLSNSEKALVDFDCKMLVFESSDKKQQEEQQKMMKTLRNINEDSYIFLPWC